MSLLKESGPQLPEMQEPPVQQPEVQEAIQEEELTTALQIASMPPEYLAVRHKLLKSESTMKFLQSMMSPTNRKGETESEGNII